MSAAVTLFNKIAADIPDAKPGKMFGAECIKLTNGKAVAMFWRDHIVVKLNAADKEKALQLKGAKLFDPMDGRPMKEWVQVPFSYADQWRELAEKSTQYVISQLKK
ncbi:hypothetical protein ACTHGU_05210 [Chitinophagaceae bacterium MMS25-I14]